MTKIEFLAAVAEGLSGLSPEEIGGQVNFLSEMIDDRIEEGLTEAEAVAAMGTPAAVAERILADSPFSAIMEDERQKKKHSTLLVVLLAVTSPIWASLLLAASVTLFTVICTLFAIAVGVGIAAVPCILITKGCWIAVQFLFVIATAGVKRLLALLNR